MTDLARSEQRHFQTGYPEGQAMPSAGELFAVAIDDIGNLEVKFRLTAAD
jgi:hypothetical protein